MTATRIAIWAYTTSPPQHIGHWDGAGSVTDATKAARAKGFGVRCGFVGYCGGPTLHMFDTVERMRAFIARNPHISTGPFGMAA